jgi:putative transcriptional regulator
MTHGRLREARRARGLTQTELADAIGVPQSTVARLETGKHEPSLRVALLLAAELETSVEALFGTPEIDERRARAAQTAGPMTTDRERPSMSSEENPSPVDDDVAQPKYKVERQLRETFPKVAKPQRSGVSVDLRVYFREKPSGDLWGGLALLNEDGEIAENMPLDSKEGLQWILEHVLCEIGFDAAPEMRTRPRSDG